MWLPLVLASALTTPIEAAPSFPIVMDLTYCYEGSRCADAEWTFFGDGRMEDNMGGEGTWRVSRGEFRLMYDHGSEYRGTLDASTRCIEGLNLHADGRRGTFEACM